MKKLFTFLIALMALCVSSWASVTQQQIGDFYYQLDDENHTATLIKNPYASESWLSYDVYGDLVISGTVNDGVDDYTVTAIGDNAFQNGGMSSLVIEEGVINIAQSAFWACSNLTKATLPSTVSSIGDYAFQSTGLTKITINATTPPSLGYYVFEQSSPSLAHIYVPSASVSTYKAAERWSDHESIIGVAPVIVEWNQAKVATVNVWCGYGNEPESQTVDGITVTASAPEGEDYSQFNTDSENTSIYIMNGGTITFAPTSGKLKSIVIECGYNDNSSNLVSGSGWSWNGGEYSGQLVWTSASEEGASSVVLACSGASFSFGSIKSAEFIFAAEEEPAPATTTTTIEWDNAEVITINLICNSVDEVQTTSAIDGITASLKRTGEGGNCEFRNSADLWITSCGELTFTSSVGDISGIVLYAGSNVYTSPSNLPSSWTWDDVARTLTWSGTAAESVTLSGSFDFLVGSIEFTVVEDEPAPAVTTTTVTWESTDVATISLTCPNVDDVVSSSEIKGITASLTRTSAGQYAYCQFTGSELWISYCGELTFTSSVGDISGILITCDPINDVWNHSNLPEGWTFDGEAKTFTWAGTPSSEVVLSGYLDFLIASIEFTVVTSAAPVDPSGAITWDADDLATISIYRRDGEGYVAPSATVKTVTAITDAPAYGDYCHLYHNEYGSSISVEKGGSLTFSLESGNFTRIVIDCGSYPDNPSNVSEGWVWDNTEAQLIWSGTAASSVTLECNDKTGGNSYDLYFNIYSIEFTVSSGAAPVDPTPSGESFTWAARQVNHVSLWCQSENESESTPVIKNIITSLTKTTNTYGNCYFQDGELGISNCGELKFKSIVGDLTRIVITCSSVTSASDLSGVWQYNSGAGTLTWTGITAAEEVTLSGNISCSITAIEFFYNPAEPQHLDEEFQDNRYLTYRITGAHTAKLIPQATIGSVVILDDYEYMGETYYITEIDDYAFYNYHDNNVEIANIHGGANIARIGAHAFENCYQLYDAILESSVIDEIGDAAFKGCQLLHAVECYTDVPPVLGSDVFDGNTYMNHINVHSAVVDDYKAAAGWSAYSAKIGVINSLPAVGEQFVWHNQTTDGVYQVTSTSPREAKVLPYPAEIEALFPITREGTLIIPEIADYIHRSYAVTGIGENAYKDSARFKMVLMPQAVKLIEEGAFRNCTGVEKVFFLWDDPTAVNWFDGALGQGKDFKTAASGETKIFVPAGKLAAYQAWAPAWASCMVEGELFDVTASVDPKDNLRYYRTFYSSTTDYMMPPSVWAHAGYVDGNAFILNHVAFDGEILPRGTAVVLESETPTYRLIPTGNDAPLYTGPNDLRGTDVAIPRISVGNNGDNVYVLGKEATINGKSQVGMGMYRYTGENLGAHKAYMILNSGSGSGSSGAQGAPIRFLFKHEDQATGTENVQSDNGQCTKMLRDGQLIIIKDGKEYNAQGQIVTLSR